MEFQPNFSYHSDTDDEGVYVLAKNNKIDKWTKKKRAKHIIKLWKSAYIRANIVGVTVNKTYANKIDKVYQAKQTRCCDEEEVLDGGRV